MEKYMLIILYTKFSTSHLHQSCHSIFRIQYELYVIFHFMFYIMDSVFVSQKLRFVSNSAN